MIINFRVLRRYIRPQSPPKCSIYSNSTVVQALCAINFRISPNSFDNLNMNWPYTGKLTGKQSESRFNCFIHMNSQKVIYVLDQIWWVSSPCFTWCLLLWWIYCPTIFVHLGSRHLRAPLRTPQILETTKSIFLSYLGFKLKNFLSDIDFLYLTRMTLDIRYGWEDSWKFVKIGPVWSLRTPSGTPKWGNEVWLFFWHFWLVWNILFFKLFHALYPPYEVHGGYYVLVVISAEFRRRVKKYTSSFHDNLKNESLVGASHDFTM